MESKIIGALVGLAGACNNNPKTKNTDAVVIKALAFPLLNPHADTDTLQDMTKEIYAEKYTVSPGCATCQSPCGNTSDYDMSRIYNAEDSIRNIKLQILSELQNLASDLYRYEKTNLLPQESMELFYKVLIYISFDMEKEGLLAFLEETQESIQKIRRDIQI